MSATKPPGGGSLVSPGTRNRVKKLGEPIALFFGRLGLTPNGLTLIGFGITVVGGVLLGLQSWLIGGIVVFIGGVFDMFDGTLARATGKVGPLGAFMDSVFDRWGEAIVYIGIGRGPDRGQLGRRRAGIGRRGDGLGVHGQLHQGQVGRPRVHHWDRHGRDRADAARGAPDRPVARADPRRDRRDREHRRHRRPGCLDPDGHRHHRSRPGDHRPRRHDHRHPTDHSCQSKQAVTSDRK